MTTHIQQAIVVAAGTLLVAMVLAAGAAEPAKPQAPVAQLVERAGIERARKQVLMLDDLYKTAIVLVTEHYVSESSDLAAGSAFQKLFGAMKEKGWHEVRLLDATGEPLVDTNSPQDDFEKAAIAALLAGKPGYEAVVQKEGKSYLRSATPIPPVMEKCHMCHDNYRGKDVIGSLSFTIPIE